jgi:hypothetical protein
LPNSSAKSAAPLHLVLERSRILYGAMVVLHGLAGIAALANPWPLWSQAGLLSAVGLSLYLTLRDHVFDPAVRGLFLNPDGHWEVLRRNGPVTATLAGSTVAVSWIVILHLVTETGIVAIPIVRDSVDPESFRRLRVYLRVSRGRTTPE